MAHRESDAHGHGTQSALAHREGHRDVEVAVEAIPFVESADRDQSVAPRRLAVTLDRVADAIGHLVEMSEILRAEPPRSSDAGPRAKRRLERREQIGQQLDRRIELQQQSPTSDAQQRVSSGAFSEIAIRVDDPDTLAPCQTVQPFGASVARALIQDQHFGVDRGEAKHGAHAAFDVLRPLVCRHRDRPGAGCALGRAIVQLARRGDRTSRSASDPSIGARDKGRVRAVILEAQAAGARPQRV